ncbi:unnamed protein product [Rotaria sp. Silwood1]|nr:unnamed protein product [Rotaria sp. Silwood1]
MDKLELFCGDTVKLKGKKRRETICIALFDDTCRDNRIRVHQVVQNNLRVRPGDIISIQGCPHVKYGTRIHVLPIEDTVNDTVGNLLQEYLQPYFLDAYRPVSVGDMFFARKGTRAVEFKVIETEPNPYCIVAPETVIYCEGEPIKREMDEMLIDEISFDDIGGLKDIKQQMKDFIQCQMEHQELYQKFGMAPPRGVLLYGPSGCGKFLLLSSKIKQYVGCKGKTMLVKALANECDVNFISIKGSELLSISIDDIEDGVRDIFNKARQTAPCILLIDELNCACKTRE